jgi:peptide/nickel transport system substrate-binding protein
VQKSIRSRRPALVFLALAMTLTLVAAACGGGGDDDSGGGSSDDGTPQSGGTLTYGLEAKTDNFCIPTAQLAISGILVVEAVYDTLMRPTRDPNVYTPYLAKSVTANADSTEWTIVLRDGVKFHDGTDLNADALKQNIDAWRGGVLLGFVFQNIADTQVTAPNTVVVTMKAPWVAFPAYLWATGRTGIAAPAQLTGDDCETNMIGTGPFMQKSFNPSTGDVSTVKNPNYWRKGLPYLDGLNFKPQEESSQRINGLQGGQYDAIIASGGVDLNQTEQIPDVQITKEPDGRMEVSHVLINVTRPPLDDLNARKAVAMAINRDEINEIANRGESRLANQIFDDRIMGHVDGMKWPKFDPKEARRLADEYKASHGGEFEFDLQSTFDQTTQAIFASVKEQAQKNAGITVNLPAPVDQAQIINQAIGGSVDAFGWRNYPGQDPDTMYVWFYSGSVVNFNHISDPEIDEALTTGRESSDEATRTQAYEAFNERMTDQIYNFWTYYTQWFIATKSSVHGVIGPNLPNEAGEPGNDEAVDVLAGYHQMLGLWKD